MGSFHSLERICQEEKQQVQALDRPFRRKKSPKRAKFSGKTKGWVFQFPSSTSEYTPPSALASTTSERAESNIPHSLMEAAAPPHPRRKALSISDISLN